MSGTRRAPAASDEHQAAHREILGLQRSAGNRAVARAVLEGVSVSPPDHPLEHEATRVAATIARAPSGPDGSAPRPLPPTRSSTALLPGAGTPLPGVLRAASEHRLGHDLGAVRIHTDEVANEAAEHLDAKAFTSGNDIYFNRGHYDPSTVGGRELVAHELTHVVQQRGGEAPIQRSTTTSKSRCACGGLAGPDGECASCRARRLAAAGESSAGLASATAPIVQRQPLEGTSRTSDPSALADELSHVPVEKWSPQIENQYRVLGDAFRADAVRACREQGGYACARLLTIEEVHERYARDDDTRRSQGKPPLSKGSSQDLAVAGAPAVALAAAAAPSLQAPAAAPAARALLTSVPMPPPAPTPAPTSAARALAYARVAAGPAAIGTMLAVAGVQLYRFGQFQESLREQGFIILESALGLCIRGCHYGPPSTAPTRFAPPPTRFAPPPTPLFPPGPRSGEELERLRRWLQRTRAAPQPLPRRAEPEDKRRRRKECDTEWVPRSADTPSQEYHNEFARQMVVDLHIFAPPDAEWRVHRGRTAVHLDYDSYDPETETYFEFKTRYDYLPYEQLGVKWFATSRLVAQARDQKETMIRCGFDGDLVWVFDSNEVANAARPYLTGADAADRVIAVDWDRTRPRPRAGGRR